MSDNNWGISLDQKPRVLLLEGIHPVAKDFLAANGCAVDQFKEAFSESELIRELPKYHALGIRSKTQVTPAALAAGKNLWTIGAFCIGTNQIDVDEASRQGVAVYNAPYSNTRSVAELVIGEMIALSRQLGDLSRMAHEGKWLKSAKGSREIRGKVLGIVGYGHIGSQVGVLAEAMGLEVIYYDVVKKLPLGNCKSVGQLAELLARADFVTLHVPATSDTQRMIGAKELQQMKKGALLINASRGSVVDIKALAEALKTEQVGGAAVDVFPEEPKSNDEFFQSELQGLRNVILTPHIGGSTEEAQEAIGREVAESFLRYFQRGSSYGAVNFPQIDPPARSGDALLLNVHRNVPGVLGEINGIISRHKVNIRSQSLATTGEIGYLVMSLEGRCEKKIVDEVAALPTSIKTRTIFS